MKDMTPHDLSMLIHFYVSPAPYAGAHTLAGEETIRHFLTSDIIMHGDRLGSYCVTTKGAAGVETILDTPIPKLAYVDAGGKLIKVV